MEKVTHIYSKKDLMSCPECGYVTNRFMIQESLYDYDCPRCKKSKQSKFIPVDPPKVKKRKKTK